MFSKTWKVFGANGHRQRDSFGESSTYDFSKDGDVRRIRVDRQDVTGTNDFVVVTVTRNTEEDCDMEMRGQITDGIFENSRVGKIEECKNINNQ